MTEVIIATEQLVLWKKCVAKAVSHQWWGGNVWSGQNSASHWCSICDDSERECAFYVWLERAMQQDTTGPKLLASTCKMYFLFCRGLWCFPDSCLECVFAQIQCVALSKDHKRGLLNSLLNILNAIQQSSLKTLNDTEKDMSSTCAINISACLD